MTEHKTIYAALAAAQMEMGKALKDSTNPAFKSKYADLASVMDACMPALNRHGIAVFQPTVDDESGRYVKTIFAHVSGETVECRVPLIVGKNDMQGYGSAVTYARRYGLMGMAGIAPEDDDGNAAAKAAPRLDDPPKATQLQAPDTANEAETETVVAVIKQMTSIDLLANYWKGLVADAPHVSRMPAVIAAKDGQKLALSRTADLAGDGIPY